MKAKEQDLDKLSTLKDVKDKLPPFTSFEGNGEKGETADIVSKKVGISRGTYERGKKIIEKGSEEVKEKLRKGQSTIYKEYNKIKKNQKREELLLQSTKKPKIGFLPSQEENCKLFCGDFQDYINSSDEEMIQDESVDLIFKDIEYLKKSLPLCRGLFFLATKKLKKGGILMTYIGQYALPEIFRYFEEISSKEEDPEQRLTYWWTNCIKHNGCSARMHKQKIFVNWKPLLWFVKGPKRRNDIEYVRDLVESTPPEKALHEWAKPVTEAAYYIKHLTLEGDTVMDPMMGSGTTGVVAINLKRKFIGIEIDKERFEIGKKRIMRDTSLSSS